MKKKTSKKPTAKNQDESTYPDDLYYDDLLNSLPNYVLTISAEEKKKRARKIKEDKAFFQKLITDFKIEDEEKFHVFWMNLEILMDCSYNEDEKGDDLLQIAALLEEITDILGFGNPTNSFRLRGVGREMLEKLEEYKEICISKHQPAKNHAPVAHHMDALVAHVGDYLTGVLGIPFRYSETITNKEKPAADFLNRTALHLFQTRRVNIRGLNAAAKRYKKKLSRAEEKPRPKAKKKPLK